MKHGTNLEYVLDSQLLLEKKERKNRFFDEDLDSAKKSSRSVSLKETLSCEALKKYEHVYKKSLKRERSELSVRRYNKMRNIIILEVPEAIQEAKDEPSASYQRSNMVESCLYQNENSERYIEERLVQGSII